MLSGNSQLRVCGLGASNAYRAANELADSGATALLSWGSAGGLDPHLGPGALVLAEHLITANGRRLSAARAWRQSLRDLVSHQLEIHAGTLLHSPYPVSTAEQKQALFAKTGAVAVDSESAAIAEVAECRRLPFVAVRAVLDPAWRDLPGSALAAVDIRGRLLMGRLLWSLLRHPGDVPGVIRLQSDLRLACATLATVARLAGFQRALPAGPQFQR